MEYRKLGATGVKVSPICLGAMMFGGPADEAASVEMINHALEAGVNFIDTANVYTQTRSEEIVGRALKGRRHEVVLATKVHGIVAPGPNGGGNSRYHIMQQVENSLRRLQTDHIDLYYLHRPDPDTSLEEEIETLSDLVRQGKVRYFGTSHYAGWQICRGLWYADSAKLAHWVVDQPRYSLIDRAIEADVVPFCQATGYGLVPHSPLAGGFLTGKYQAGQAPPNDSRFARQPERFKALEDERNLAVLDVVNTLAREHNCSVAQVAIAWVIAKPFISSTIIGPRTVAQTDDNLAAAEVKLSPDEIAALDDVSAYAAALPRL